MSHAAIMASALRWAVWKTLRWVWRGLERSVCLGLSEFITGPIGLSSSAILGSYERLAADKTGYTYPAFPDLSSLFILPQCFNAVKPCETPSAAPHIASCNASPHDRTPRRGGSRSQIPPRQERSGPGAARCIARSSPK